MAIQLPNALIMGEKRICMLIAGHPGIGKSTLSLSAPEPLHIDVDFGLDRVPALYRKPFIQPSTYDELLEDLVPENLRDFETLVFDTGGQLLKLFLTPWVIRQNSKNGQSDGTLSLKGYGAVGREFERLMKYCFIELNKHVVVLFHAKEEKEGDYTRLRLSVERQTKDNVWQPMDLGGFMEMQGTKRTLGLSNCERYFAKGTHGVTGIRVIPELKANTTNDFLTKLFRLVNDNIAQEEKEVAAIRDNYEAAMDEACAIIEGIETPEDATAAVEKMKDLQHALTSEKESKAMFTAKIKALGFTYDKTQGVYMKCAS